jgi:hypothetical protein
VQDAVEPLGAFDRVVLVPRLVQAGCRARVQIGSQRHHQHVRVVRTPIGDRSALDRVDRHDGLPSEPNADLVDVPVVASDRFGRTLAEHHVELGEPEHERVALVDERDLHVAAERGGQPRGQLEASEASPENDHGRAHGASL